MQRLLKRNEPYDEEHPELNTRSISKRNLEGDYTVRVRPGKVQRGNLHEKRYRYKAKVILIDVHDRALYDYFVNVAIKKLSNKRKSFEVYYVVANNDSINGNVKNPVADSNPRAISYEEFLHATALIEGSFMEVSSEHGTNMDVLFNRLSNDLIDAKGMYRLRLIADKGTLL
jgi:hypothetical protein